MSILNSEQTLSGRGGGAWGSVSASLNTCEHQYNVQQRARIIEQCNVMHWNVIEQNITQCNPMKCSTIRCEKTAMQCSRIIEQTCMVAQSGQRSLAALALHLQDLYCVSYWYWFEIYLFLLFLVITNKHWYPCTCSVFREQISFIGIIHFKKPGRHPRNTQCITQIRLHITTWHNPWVLTGDDHLMIIVWSSDCHLIAIRWSLLRPVWYHGWIAAQSSDHDAVAGVSVVTLVALLTLGTFGNHASAPPETQHKSSAPLF